MNRGAALLVALLMVTSAVGTAAGASAATTTETGTASSSTNAEAYAGAHVDFEVDGDAVTDYRVGGEETFSAVSVQSKSEADAGADAGLDASADADLETVSGLAGADLSLAAQTETSARVQAESGATLSAHDNQRGTLVVRSGNEGQYVEAELAAGASAEDEGNTVRVETDDREGVFLVVGDGEVTVNDDGNVTADLSSDATLAYRSYEDGERDDDAAYEESLIADGKAAAEVHVEARDGEAAESAVTYGEETSAEVSQAAESRVEMTVERAHGEGTVVITTVSEEAVGTLEDIDVTVDGEAAVEASSTSELEAATQNGDRSHYMVAQNAEAQGEATVYVAFNHFSERTATIDGSSDDSGDSGAESDDSDDTGGETADETESDGSDDSETADGDDGDATDETSETNEGSESTASDTVPGFGAAAAVIAIAVAGLLARLER